MFLTGFFYIFAHMKEKWILSNDSDYYVRRRVKPVEGYKTDWKGSEVLSEKEINEIRKTFTYEYEGKIIPVYIEVESISIRKEKRIIKGFGYESNR